MKTLLALALFVSLTGRTVKGQTYGMVQNASITVPVGQVCELLSFTRSGLANSCYLTVDGNSILAAKETTSSGTAPGPINIFIPGPKTIGMTVGSGVNGTCTYRLFPNGGSVPITNQPSNSVVIPTNASGPVQIILESSVDLVTWTAANPGTYSPTTANRFFRVRAVQQ